MISLLTTVQIIDNSGGIIGRCIKILKPHNRKYAKLGELILVSILKTIPGSKIRKGEVYKATIIRTKRGEVKFDSNGKSGFIEKSVNIRCNTSRMLETVKIKANIKTNK